jgi:hypothetical protein
MNANIREWNNGCLEWHTTSSAAAGQRQLTMQEAEYLTRAALRAATKRLPGLSLEYPKHYAHFEKRFKISISEVRRSRPLAEQIDVFSSEARRALLF